MQYVCKNVYVSVSVCVCMCERERERFSTQGPSPHVCYVPLSLPEMEAPSRSCLPLQGHLASTALAGLPQRCSVIIHSVCQASSQLGSCSFSVWKGWASSLILELSRSSAVWLEDKPENYGRANETAGSLSLSLPPARSSSLCSSSLWVGMPSLFEDGFSCYLLNKIEL